MRICYLVLVLMGFLLPVAHGQDYVDLYGLRALQKEKPRLEARIEQLRELLPQAPLEADEARILARVNWEFPLHGQGPYDFHSNPELMTITLPILSLKFFEDLALAQAWLNRNGFSTETVEEYVAMLKYKKLTNYPSGKLISPLAALQIPEEQAWNNASVERLALDFRNRGWMFILLHELGHVYHAHPPYAPGIPRRRARANEIEADRFAVKIMARFGSFPMGALLFFQSGLLFFPNRADWDSDEVYDSYLDREATHPMTADRASALAQELRLHLSDFAKNEPTAEKKKFAVQTFRESCDFFEGQAKEYLQDTDIQRVFAQYGELAPVEWLVPRRPLALSKGWDARIKRIEEYLKRVEARRP